MNHPRTSARSFRHLFVAALACAVCIFGSASALADDPAPTPAPASQQAPPAPASSTTNPAPVARREDVEPSTLQEAKTLLATARSERDLAEKASADENAAHGKTRQILATTISTCQAAQKERDDNKTALTAMTGERDREQAAHKKTSELLNLAEGALQVKGITTAQAVPAAAEPGAKLSVADYEARIKAAKTPAEEQAIAKEFEKALSEGRVA